LGQFRTRVSKRMLSRVVFFAVVTGSGFTAAHAGFQYSVSNPSGNDAAGNVSQIFTTYDDVNEKLSWSFTIDAIAPGLTGSGQLSDGFWLAISPGPNPKGEKRELAIFYGDVRNNRLTAYEYSGKNNANSFKRPGNLLGSFALNSTDNGTASRTMSFDIDVSAINSYRSGSDWTGAAYGEHIGYWLHPVFGSTFKYDGDALTRFRYTGQGWYDKSWKSTSSWDGFSSVPEPSSLVIMATAFLGGIVLRRRSRKRNHITSAV
jgi:PEP-CTERM motif